LENCRQNFVAGNYDVEHAKVATDDMKGVNTFAKSVVELNRAIDVLVKRKQMMMKKQQVYVVVLWC
jgi:predicted outer membrane protein